MLLRQVQARPLQGDHLRALRRRGDAPEGAPRAHGSHRPRRPGHRTSGSSRASRAASATCSTSLRASSRRSSTSPPRSSPRSTTRRAPRTSNDLEDKVKAESEQIYVDRDEALAALEQRLQRRRDYFAKGKDKGFDEDDDFWARGLNNWAEEAGAADARGGAQARRRASSRSSPSTVTTEDPKKIRELVRATATRSDRKLAPREHRAGRDRGAADPGGARAAPRRARRRRPARRRAR